MKKIKITLIGSMTRKGFKLKNLLRKIIRTKDYDIDYEEINNMGQKRTPVLIIDDEIIDTSKVYNTKKMNSIINKYVSSY